MIYYSLVSLTAMFSSAMLCSVSTTDITTVMRTV